MPLSSYLNYLKKDEIKVELIRFGLIPDESLTVDKLRDQLRHVTAAARRGSYPTPSGEEPVPDLELALAEAVVASMESKLPGATPSSHKRTTARANYWLDRISRIKSDDSKMASLRARLIKVLSVSDCDENEDDECKVVHSQPTPRETVVYKDSHFNINSSSKFVGIEKENDVCEETCLQQLSHIS